MEARMGLSVQQRARLLGACPGGERQELLLKALRVAAPMGDTAGQLARAVVEDDVQRTQVSANGLHSALTQALQRLGGATFMDTLGDGPRLVTTGGFRPEESRDELSLVTIHEFFSAC
eukprot:Skav208715  [mRNA]  locus=scaffold42:938879:943192:+ [translate_table: standard]